MNLTNNNINLEEMYKYQLNELNTDDYNEYKKYLNLFFLKDHKKDKYNKDFLNGKYILIDKNNPKKKIIITPAEFVNIHKLYIELKKNTDLILHNISNLIETKNNITNQNRDEFENLKNKYEIVKNKLKSIDTINQTYYNEMQGLFTEKIEKTMELAKYYQKRNIEYSNIKTMIPEILKNKLIRKFKENNRKIISLTEINKIAKENNIDSKEIEKWFLWIEVTYFYLLTHNEIVNIKKKINTKEKDYDMNTNYMIIKKPVLEKK